MSRVFDPPNADQGSPGPAHHDGQGPRSIQSLASTLRVLLMVWLGASGILLLTEIVYFALDSAEALDILLVFTLPVIAVQIVVYLTCATVWCMWSYRIATNLRALHIQGMQYTPGWVAGSWFVPILNLFRPYQVTKELFIMSDPDDQMTPPPSYLGLWWGTWIVTGILGQISMRLALDGVEGSELIDPVQSVVAITMGVLALTLVKDLTKRHSQLLAAHAHD